MDEIKKIYENKVIPFENTDDSYKSKMSTYYSEWSSMGDKFSDAGNAIKDFMTGVWDSLAGTVMGLLTLVADLEILYVDVRWKSIVPIQVPEVLDQEVEKIKQKYKPLLKNPVNTIGGIGQSICDTADEKGVAYSSGYIVTEVVTALLADKGLDKIKNVAKTGKTADNVADIAEERPKGARNAAEDAGKAGKGLEKAAKGAESAAEDAGKVVESGKYSLSNVEARKWYLEQEAKIPDMIDKSLPLEEQAKQAFNLRNQFRMQARELMADRATVESLYKTDPNLAWEEIVRKQRAKGLEGDDIYKAIIESSQRSRKSVNKSLGLE